MAAKSIPAVGEAFLGDVPGVVKVQKVTLGAYAATADVNGNSLSTTEVVELFDVGAGTRVIGMTKQNLTKWFAAVNISIGDGDAASGYFISTAEAATVTDAAPVNMISGGGAYTGGRIYTASDTIDATIVKATALSDTVAGVGLTEICIHYVVGIDS
jgi:hypothetical protein